MGGFGSGQRSILEGNVRKTRVIDSTGESILMEILIELKIMNLHLESMTILGVTNEDMEGN